MIWRKILQTDLGDALRRRTQPASPGAWRGPRDFMIDRRHRDLMVVTKQLEGFVGANVDLVGALEAVAAGATRRRLERLYHALANDLTIGSSLAGAMRKRSRFFPRYYCDLVEAGENTGTLERTFAELSDYLESRKTTPGESVAGWLTYVLAVLMIQAAIAAFILIKVFPILYEIGEDFGGSRPVEVSFVIALGDFVQSYWWVLLDGLFSAVVIWLFVRHLLRARGLFDEAVGWIVSGIPALRALLAKRDLAHISLVLERLLGGGVPLATALEDAAALDINPVYARVLRGLARRIFEGETLHNAMEQESHKLLPASFRGLVSIGERSGLLPEAFGRIGRLYQREAIKTRRVLTQGLMPLCLAVPVSVTLLVALTWFATYAALMDAFLAQI